ncbi:MAG TPA: hypothetical protein VGG24_03055 [Paraburkholderia sp.]|jgi:hypothetical protein
MKNELEGMHGQILGVVGALNAIAAVLPGGTSAHAAEVLADMIAATRDNGLAPQVTEAMHSTMHQIRGALQVNLERPEPDSIRT